MAQRTRLLESAGDIRAQGSFQTVAYVNGTYTLVSSMKMVALVSGVTANSSAGDSDNIQTWVQPANSLITAIDVWCVTAAAIASGDLGCEVGTVSGQGEIVVEDDNVLLSTGTDCSINSVAQLVLVQVTQSENTFAISAQYTAAARNIFCNITDSTNASTQGSFTFIISYIDLNDSVAA